MSPGASESEMLPGSPHPDEQDWSTWKWIMAFVVVFGFHVGLFFFLAERTPKPRPTERSVTQLHFSRPVGEFLQLEDPTLFALPNLRGFAAFTWLRSQPVRFAPFRWTESLRFLPLPVSELGETFLQLVETNQPPSREISITPAPLVTVLPSDEPLPLRTNTEIRVEGALAVRPLRFQPERLPLAQQDNLTNTVVQVLVDASGQVISTVILPSGSGAKAEDGRALQIARNLWFEPTAKSSATTTGWIIFEWATARTNATTRAQP